MVCDGLRKFLLGTRFESDDEWIPFLRLNDWVARSSLGIHIDPANREICEDFDYDNEFRSFSIIRLT